MTDEPEKKSVRCPKCWSDSPLEWEAECGRWPYGPWPPDPFKEPIDMGGGFFAKRLYECPIHGSFALDDAGEGHFCRPELTLGGPGGRRFFKT